jgi:transposase
MTETYSPKAVERAMKVQEIMLRAMSGQILWIQAADILGISARQMRRWKCRYEHRGYDGLFDRRKRTPSPRRVPLATVEQILHLYREKYYDFNARHFCEKLMTEHQIKISYNWLRLALQGAGLMQAKHRGSTHRLRRPRKPVIGMMLHMDGSPHDWLGTGDPVDLIAISDDANNEVYDIALVDEEDSASCMQMVRNVVEKEGVFCSLYTDRGSHFFYTKKAGEDVVKDHVTQFARALKELGIQPIAAYSPEARGRSERLNETLQGRLPQELRLRGIKTKEAANKFLREEYIKMHNRSFKRKAEQEGSAFLPAPASVDLDKVFSFKHERTVNKDNTISFNNRILQITPSHLRVSFAKCKVMVFEHLDKSISIGFGPHVLGYYSPNGMPLTPKQRMTKNKINPILTIA